MDVKNRFSNLKEKIKTPDGTILYEKQDLDEKAKQYRHRSKNIFKKWDVYWAGVQFEDDHRYYKIRPVIISKYLNNSMDLEVLTCTHILKEGRYPIKNYLNLGFSVPTYVVYDNPMPVSINYIFDPASKPLSKKDIIAINDLIIDKS